LIVEATAELKLNKPDETFNTSFSAPKLQTVAATATMQGVCTHTFSTF